MTKIKSICKNCEFQSHDELTVTLNSGETINQLIFFCKRGYWPCSIPDEKDNLVFDVAECSGFQSKLETRQLGENTLGENKEVKIVTNDQNNERIGRGFDLLLDIISNANIERKLNK